MLLQRDIRGIGELEITNKNLWFGNKHKVTIKQRNKKVNIQLDEINYFVCLANAQAYFFTDSMH